MPGSGLGTGDTLVYKTDVIPVLVKPTNQRQRQLNGKGCE